MAKPTKKPPVTDESLSTLNGLQSARSKERINQVSRLSSYGIVEFVSLPHIAVFGDQSSGKSSALEGVTGMPFPRQDGVCTRFPTEIVLRLSSSERSIVATVKPHSSRSPKTRLLFSRYKRTMRDMLELPQVTQEVSALMDLRGHAGISGGDAFASDVLRIEVTGHTDFNLTVVDMPGLISVANEEQTNADVQLIRAMIDGYMASSRTIILAVVQAGNDIANQSIIELARKHDPQGQRTVGIITKADLINQGTEGRLVELAMNQGNVKLEHGFFLLKNPSPAELENGISAQLRSRKEIDFFSKPVWQSHGLDMSRVGVENLRTSLQDLLDSHIGNEMPNVTEEVKLRLRETEASLTLLGPERSKISDVRYFITKISIDYCRTVQAALNGDCYGGQQGYFLTDPNSNLRALVHKLNTNFATRVRDEGQKRTVTTDSYIMRSEKVKSTFVKGVVPEVERLLVTEGNMKVWVQSIYVRTRGRELPGNQNYVLLAELFREQSSLWELLAQAHIRDVFAALVQWIQTSVEVIVPEARIRQEILAVCLRWIEDTRARAGEELGKLVADEKLPPLTYNHYYTDNIQDARRDAAMIPIQDTLKTVLKLHKAGHDYTGSLNTIKANVIADMDQQACSDALICLNAYYKVSPVHARELIWIHACGH
ncbi:hypothetical protein PG995_003126 [Apiospora arundinis]